MSAELLLILILMTDRVNEVLAENSPFPGLNAQILSGFTRLVYLNWVQFFFPYRKACTECSEEKLGINLSRNDN